MGFLSIFGRVLRWDESKPYHKIIKDNAVKVILNLIKTNTTKYPQFGYEFEFHKIHIDHKNKNVQLDLSGQDDIINSSTYNLNVPFHLSHEYGGWMIEVIHDNPFQFDNIGALIPSVNHLYHYLNEKIGKYKYLSFPSFPRLGCGNNYYKLDHFWKEKFRGDNNSKDVSSDSNCSDDEQGENCFILGKESDTKITKQNLIECNNNNNKNGDDGVDGMNNINEDKGKQKEAVQSELEAIETCLKTETEDIRTNPFTKSIFINDCIINRHPRFGNLSRNIRYRRGKKVNIQIPIFKDTHTSYESTTDEPYPGYVYMDAMAFGMGNCCTQVTLGACCLNSATYLYDQFLPITPILLALSATCPVYKGKLTNYDDRYSLICQGVDDRTDDEQNPQSTNYICKSRYSPAYSYISDSLHSHDFNNDYPAFPINKEYYDEFIKNGMSAKLSQHFANVLVRDPLVIFSEKIEINDIKDMTHFETINSSNWNSVRFKLPRVSDGDNCFKVEIRPCDLQMTPYENTSMIAFILGLHAIIMRYDTNFIMPISKVDINFERSYLNDAINTQKFYWRINSVKGDKMQQLGFGKYNSYTEEQREKITYEEDQENIKELTINEIINGCERYNYPGILHIVIDAMKEYYKAEELIEYIKFVGKRASGELWTGAKFVRNFIMNNKLYKHDSIIGQELAYELVCLVEKIQNGEIKPKEMFG